PTCATQSYWSQAAPSLFCFTGSCPTTTLPAQTQVTRAFTSQPKANAALQSQAYSQHTTVAALMKDLLDQTVGDPYRWMAGGGTSP
ncbi:MAG TPA: hypothetical protein VNN79_15235, partial [Actinomycetota bacterium]|nr:hypothetical protein [Actinomycetota bacterium]